MVRLRIVPALVVTALALTACAGPNAATTPDAVVTSPSPSATASASASTSPADTSTPSATPTASPTPSEPYLTTAGWGDIKLGAPVPESTTLVEWDQLVEGCGLWTTKPSGVAISTAGKRDGTVTGIEAWDAPDLRTKSGAHIGMSRSDLEALFPDASHPDDRLYIVKDSLGQVVFDVDGDAVAYMRVVPVDQKVTATGGHGFCD